MADAQPNKMIMVSISLVVMGMGASVFMLVGSGGDSSEATKQFPGHKVDSSRPAAVDQVPQPAVLPPPAPEPVGALPVPVPNTMQRNLARERIWTVLGEKHSLEPAEAGSAAPTASAAGLLPSLDRDFVSATMQGQLVPVARSCAEAGAGLVVDLAIIGAEGVGSIVEDTQAAADSRGSDEGHQCVLKALAGVTLAAPPQDGRSVVQLRIN